MNEIIASHMTAWPAWSGGKTFCSLLVPHSVLISVLDTLEDTGTWKTVRVGCSEEFFSLSYIQISVYITKEDMDMVLSEVTSLYPSHQCFSLQSLLGICAIPQGVLKAVSTQLGLQDSSDWLLDSHVKPVVIVSLFCYLRLCK